MQSGLSCELIESVLLLLCYAADQSDPSFMLQSSVQLFQSLHRCWDADIYLPPLCHRFWKLTLQLVSRYATWIIELQDEVSQKLQTHQLLI